MSTANKLPDPPWIPIGYEETVLGESAYFTLTHKKSKFDDHQSIELRYWPDSGMSWEYDPSEKIVIEKLINEISELSDRAPVLCTFPTWVFDIDETDKSKHIFNIAVLKYE